MSSSEKDSTFKKKQDEAIENGTEIFEKITYMPTLPNAFKSLAGKTVKIETEEPQCIIELLGDLLGITDYKINKAAFWFLDTVALYVLRYKNCLDDHYRGVLISWLAGEMILIRGAKQNIFLDKKFSREDFFKEMKILFLNVAERLLNGDQLPHWELLVDEYPKIMSKNSTTDKSIKRAAEYLVTNKSSENESPTENSKPVSQENTRPFEKDSKIPDSGEENKESVANVQEKPSNISTNLLSVRKLQTNTCTNANKIIESSNLIDSSIVLDVIIEATYSMYANEFRYALIHAVFVTPIPMEIYQMRHILRAPHQIKLADPKRASIDVQLYERLKKFADMKSEIGDGNRYKGKRDNAKEEGAVNDTEVPPTPPPSLNDEEMPADNRQFILPLIEANEPVHIFGIYANT